MLTLHGDYNQVRIAMNAERRKELDKLIPMAEDLAARVREIADEEREAFDAMPEGAQQGDKGQTIEQNADDLATIADELEGHASTMQEVRDR
jgi:septal ring factor EnvC (AmiA/AmiB activator)